MIARSGNDLAIAYVGINGHFWSISEAAFHFPVRPLVNILYSLGPD